MKISELTISIIELERFIKKLKAERKKVVSELDDYQIIELTRKLDELKKELESKKYE